ncbi:hypothetical protein BpHYR1_037981 [Brachionus plicatilis]|uniref:Uncharacterized protein n=1 Tax=Brachionus plicatilis TaxID=10195 RepID=A0A3M7QMZ6_BRAPC|nr:hypothetical protein BpHYR1_037981 [Brachionus plicatilis]
MEYIKIVYLENYDKSDNAGPKSIIRKHKADRPLEYTRLYQKLKKNNHLNNRKTQFRQKKQTIIREIIDLLKL